MRFADLLGAWIVGVEGTDISSEQTHGDADLVSFVRLGHV